MNPANYHPLREILKNQIDFDTLSRSDKIKLFVCASNVFTNRLRVFDLSDISVDGVVASPASRRNFKPSGSTGNFTGTGAIWETRRSFLSLTTVSRSTCSHHGQSHSYRADAQQRASHSRPHKHSELQLQPDAEMRAINFAKAASGPMSSCVTISKRSARARRPRSSSVSCESLCASNGFCRVFYDSWV